MRLILILLSVLATCTASFAIASPMESLLRHCLQEGSSSSAVQMDLEKQGWIRPSSGQLDELANAMAAFALFQEDGGLPREALEAKFRAGIRNFREVIDNIQAGKIDGLQGIFVAHPDGAVAGLSWIVSQFDSGPRVYASCSIFVPTAFQRTTIIQSVQSAANDPYLERSERSVGANIDVVEWTNFDNVSAYLRELTDLPNTGDRLLAINTVTSFSQ